MRNDVCVSLLKMDRKLNYALFCFEALLGGVRIVELFFNGELNDAFLVDESFSFSFSFLFLSLPIRLARIC